LRAIAQAQAAQYVRDVVFDGSLADHKLLGNLAIRSAFGDQAKHLNFTPGQVSWSKHKDIPKFVELGRRLEELKKRHEQGLLVNLAFIKQLLEIAREVVEAEKEIETTEEQDKGKAALTELFNEVRNGNTSVMVERIVNDIDQIVRIVRFPGWQQTIAGDREVKQALRKTLLKYKLHQEQDLFDRAYQYIKQYY
jgi:type I restriction enzyme, R subunit